MRCEVEPESAEIAVLGTIAAGQPIEALPCPQTLSIPKEMVGRFETYALRVEGHSMVDENIHGYTGGDLSSLAGFLSFKFGWF
jgi:SOS-response transcriptional repressor LexA